MISLGKRQRLRPPTPVSPSNDSRQTLSRLQHRREREKVFCLLSVKRKQINWRTPKHATLSNTT
jgi:hypothetical protein